MPAPPSRSQQDSMTAARTGAPASGQRGTTGMQQGSNSFNNQKQSEQRSTERNEKSSPSGPRGTPGMQQGKSSFNDQRQQPQRNSGFGRDGGMRDVVRSTNPAPRGGLGSLDDNDYLGGIASLSQDERDKRAKSVSRGYGSVSGIQPDAPEEARKQLTNTLSNAWNDKLGINSTPAQVREALRTIAGEAAGESLMGQAAAFNTMSNRLQIGQVDPRKDYGGGDVMGMLSGYDANGQRYAETEGYSGTPANDMYKDTDYGDEAYRNAALAMSEALSPTSEFSITAPKSVINATNYLTPKAAAKTSWVNDSFTKFGGHLFGNAEDISGRVASLRNDPNIQPASYEPKKANVYDATKPYVGAGLGKIADFGKKSLEKIKELFGDNVPTPQRKPSVLNLGARADTSYYGDFKAPTQDFTSPEQEAELDRISGVVNRISDAPKYGFRGPTQDFTSPEDEAELDRISEVVNRIDNPPRYGFRGPTQDFTSPEDETELDRIAEVVNRPRAQAAGTLTSVYDRPSFREQVDARALANRFRADEGLYDGVYPSEPSEPIARAAGTLTSAYDRPESIRQAAGTVTDVYDTPESVADVRKQNYGFSRPEIFSSLNADDQAPYSNLANKVPRDVTRITDFAKTADADSYFGDIPSAPITRAPQSWTEIADARDEAYAAADRPRALGADKYGDPDGIRNIVDSNDTEPTGEEYSGLARDDRMSPENYVTADEVEGESAEPDVSTSPERDAEWARYNNKIKSKSGNPKLPRTKSASAAKAVINGIVSTVPGAKVANAIAGIFGKSAGEFVAADMDRWNAMNPDQRAEAIARIRAREEQLALVDAKSDAQTQSGSRTHSGTGAGVGHDKTGGGTGETAVTSYTPRSFRGFPTDINNYGQNKEFKFYEAGGLVHRAGSRPPA